jgi:CRISPR type I-D-associated protein Csc2
MSVHNSLSEIIKPENISIHLKPYLRKPDEKDRVFPKNKKIEIVFLIEAVNAILPRTEGVEDITLIKLPGTEYEVPMILPEKLQAVSRRRMLAYLRDFRDKHPDKLKEYLSRLAKVITVKKRDIGFKIADQYKDKPNEWNCYIQPPGGDIRRATDVGMDGFCPACALFGVVLDSTKIKNINEAIGIKSRVEFDPAIAFMDKEKTTAPLTHNKVAEGVSWTGQSLYTEYHVVPGTVFIGKVTLEDVTETELKAFLAVLSTIDRLGGRERVFGGVRIHIVGIKGGRYETVSALEIAKHLARIFADQNILPDIGKVMDETRKYIAEKGFSPVDTGEFRKLVDNDELWDKLWSDTEEFDKQIIERVVQLVMEL